MSDKKKTVFILYSRMVATSPERNLHKFDHIKLLLGPKCLVTPIFVKARSTRLSLTHFTHIFVFFQQSHTASRVFLSSRAVRQGGFCFYKAERNQEIFKNSVAHLPQCVQKVPCWNWGFVGKRPKVPWNEWVSVLLPACCLSQLY